MLKSAKFNLDHTHRLFLTRLWEPDNSKILFIGLNPSTADEKEDDNTVTRLINFSKSWGFGGFYLTNLYTYISSDPDVMIDYYHGLKNTEFKALHRTNMKIIDEKALICSMIVFCWGATVGHDDIAASQISRRHKQARCFGHTKDGHPKHPLYLPSHTQLTMYR